MSDLPEAVRRRVVDVAAERLGVMPADEVPMSLRPFAKFTPSRRRQAVLPIAAALENDPDFRDAVAQGLRDNLPDLVAALEQGGAVPAADPVDVAAAAYLLRTEGWQDRVATVASAEAAGREEAALAKAREATEAARRSADADVRSARERITALEAELARVATDVERERRRAREAMDRARAAEQVVAELTAARDAAVTAAASAGSAAEAELRSLRERLASSEAALERVRRDTRESREAADIRRWLLLDTLARAVGGLREELSPQPPTRRPADLVAASEPVADDGAGLSPDDPATVDVLLALPNAHLVVDGYNVTKNGYPDLPLEDQRNRLVSGLAALAARTGAEVTCVFDGAEVQVRVPTAAARRVRVRFSPPGEIADELIRRLVRAEPTGRPVTVCSADKEVVNGVRRSGARTVSPQALLARLART